MSPPFGTSSRIVLCVLLFSHHRITTANICKSERPSDIQRLVELASIAHCSPNIQTKKNKTKEEAEKKTALSCIAGAVTVAVVVAAIVAVASSPHCEY